MIHDVPRPLPLAPAHQYPVMIRSLLLATLAFLIRVAFIQDFASQPLFDANLASGTDMEFLVAWARRVAGGDVFGRGTGPFWWAPLYPYTLGAVFALLGPDALHGAAVVQGGLGALTCVLVYQLGRRLCTEAIGLTAGLLAAVYGPALFYAGVFLSTTLEVFLALSTLLVVTMARTHPSPARWLSAGMVAGLACLARPNFLLATALLAALVPVLARPAGSAPAPGGARRAAVFVLGVFLIIAPVSLRNWTIGGRFVLISAAGPETFRIANSYDSTPLNFIYPKAAQMPLASAAFWRHQARKAALFWWGFEAPQNVNYYLARELTPVLKLPWLAFWVAVPLAGLGLWVTRHRRRALLHVYTFLAAYYVSVVAFFVIARWRLPLVIPLLIFTAAGLLQLIDWVRARRLWTAGGAAAIVGLLAWQSFPGAGPFVFPADHGQLGYILANRGEHAAAAQHLGLAARGLPDTGTLHRDLGALLLRLDRLAEARPALEHAVLLLPADGTAHHQLGKLLLRAGEEPARARQLLERAAALGARPAALAEIRALLGRLDGGRERLDTPRTDP